MILSLLIFSKSEDYFALNGQDADDPTLPATPPTNHYDRTAFPLQRLRSFPRSGEADQYDTIRPPAGNHRVGCVARAPREVMLGEDGASGRSELQSAYAELQSPYAIPSELDRNVSADGVIGRSELQSAYAIPSELGRSVSADDVTCVCVFVCVSCVSMV